MAPKLNKKDSSLDQIEHKRRSRNSTETRAFRKEKSELFRLTEREVKHQKISSAKELYDAYTFGNEIGKGTFGTVMAVVDKATNKNWALKIISKPAAGKQIKYVHNELRILKMVDHPHIVYLDKVFETEKKIYLLLERCIGELADLLRNRGKFAENDAQKVLSELCDAVAYLHKYDIVHRDLKLENILLARNPDNPEDEMYVKVADFGLSTVKKGVTYAEMLKDQCGTLMYMSPEMVTGSKYSQQCDIWSMGVILYLLLVGRFPFFSKDEEKLAKLICFGEIDYDQEELSVEVKDLLSKMLATNPAVRITASEVMQHPWTTGKVMSGHTHPANVLEMMRLWRSEMKVTSSDDWLAATNVSRRREPSSTLISDKKPSHQYLQIPKTNIEFNRSAQRHNKNDSKNGVCAQDHSNKNGTCRD